VNRAMDHLTSAQIDEYVLQDHKKAADGQYRGLEAHLVDCEPCLDRVLQAHRMHLGLLEGDRMNKTRYPGCPAETTLQELAAGISPPEIAEATAQHAAHCDSCGPLLSMYVKEFSDDLELEDAAILKQLESSKPKWQKKFIRQHLSASQETSERSFFARLWPGLATAAAAAAMAAVGIFVWVNRSNDLSHAQQLVASAYAERRTTEMRLPSAPHARFTPIPVVKGSADSGDWNSQPAPLVEAETIVKRKTGAGNLNPQWLQVEGRIDLLEGSQAGIEHAIDSFEKALAVDAQNPSLKVDLATALFEKEMRADHDHPVLARTIDLLTDVTKDSTQATDEIRKTALFNLALAYEKSEVRDLAISSWEKYLQLDKTSEWSKEAQQHLDDLRNHAPPPRQQGYTQPAYFLSHSSDPDVLANLEEFQDIALRSWLPTAIEDPSSESGRAVAELAQLLKKTHSDPWMQDLLHHAAGDDASAVKTLSQAFTFDLNDLHYQGVRESQKAAVLFRQQHNLAGELRARYQEVYGLQRSLAADDCIERINELWPRVFATEYRWLQGQLALEKATCANLNFDFETAALNVAMSRSMARQFRFPEFGLRVAGFDAGIQRGQENYDHAWKEAVEGLGLYWKGKCGARNSTVQEAQTAGNLCSYSLERLYQFYSVMQQCARKMGFQHASEALLLQGIATLENSAPDDIILRATLSLRLADILFRQGNIDLAEQKASKAESLLKEVSTSDPTAQLYAAVTRIELAEFELNRGNATSALSKLEPLRGLLSSQDDFVRLDFHTIEGEIFRQLGQFENAVKSYQSAVEIAERSLGDSQDDRSQLNWRLGTGKAYRGLTRSLLALGRDRDALIVWERFKSQSLMDAASDAAERGRLELGGSSLPSVAQPHLIYASFQDGLQVWLLSGSQIRSKWIPLKREELQHQVLEFAKECADPSLRLDKAQTLYKQILQPIAADFPPSSAISVELDEPMWGLTLEALQSSTGRYFADEHPVIYSPGLLAEQSLRKPRSLTGRGPMLLVDASQAIATAPLPGHLDEVAAIKRTFANTKILGPSAISPDEIRQALNQSSEFHFTGHGKREGTGTALVISSETSLRTKDFAPRRLQHLQLAVLSACSSASARNGAFDQSNLVRSFLAGGVPAVIASRWDVDSRSTAHFMQSFYASLRSGQPVPAALQYAQAEMRSVNSHPYYWAAFTMSGRVN
jgi:CHAT domain-containing protein